MKQKYKNFLPCIVIFICYFTLQLISLNDAWFISDELDIMEGGKTIARGYTLYRDYLSQHMPLSYYISAFFDLLGATTVEEQRMAFYAFFALSWVIIYIRYKNIITPKILAIYPLIFLVMIRTYGSGTTILSEHIASIGFAILFLEYLKFLQTNELDLYSCIFISIAVLLTFGTIFVAIFGVFVVAVGVLAKEIEWNTENLKNFLLNLIKKYWKLIAFICFPWLLYVLYLLLTKNLYNFFFSAYKLNRDIYSQYLPDGLGNSILGSFLGMIAYFFEPIQQILYISSDNAYSVYCQLFIVFLCIVYITTFFKKYGTIAGFTCIFLLLSLGVRGQFNFHATHCVALLSLMASTVLCENIFSSNSIFCKNLFSQSLAIFLLLLFFSGYAVNFINLANIDFEESNGNFTVVLDTITENNEAIWNLTLSLDEPMKANRASINNVGAVPWFWDGFGNQTLEKFNNNSPRVVLLCRDLSVWGYNISDYGKDLFSFVDSNYTQYQDSWIYIRNDYYQEALDKLAEVH